MQTTPLLRLLIRVVSYLLAALAAPAGVSAVVAAEARPATSAVLLVPAHDGPIAFGVGDLEAALETKGIKTIRAAANTAPITGGTWEIDVSVATDPARKRAPESFTIQVTNHATRRRLRIEGADAAGAMYGALEVAELIRTRGLDAVVNREVAPAVAERGIKFNLPLDARSPSYSDASDSAQQNIATVWDPGFWREFIDRLARNRFNLVSLWNLHPFPSLVRVPEYPDVALADVHRSHGPWREHHTLQATGLDAPELLANAEVLKRLTIEEKIAFWREVMRYGRERNVKFYVITWNVFTNGVAGKYGITPAMSNPTTIDYFRRSVRQLMLTYPDLAGIGLTTGEYMPDATPAEKEAWAFATYGQGVLDALEREPGRRITFVHRQHEAGAAEIARQFGALLNHPRVDFVYSFKYAEAHALSSTKQRFHEKFLPEIDGRQTLWTLRNDDVYHVRWGGAGFVREFLQNLPAGPTRGFYYGSDQWIWGREFLSTERGANEPRELELSKHWYHWLLWGRLGYEPALPDERLVALLQERFPGADATTLFTAWQDASMIYPLTTGFHWGALDFQWYIEACQSRAEPAQTPSGFHDINRFISLAPHPASGNQSIPDFVKATRAGAPTKGTSPLETSARLHAHADRALAAADSLQPAVREQPELRRTLEDIRIMAQLGKYYGHKIRAATELALYRANHDPIHQRAVAAELNQAALRWRVYASSALAWYQNPVWTNRVGHVDWRRTYASVLHDLTSTGSPIEVPSMPPTPGGTILEAEDATTNGAPVASIGAGFTGKGYRDFNRTQGTRWIEWTYEAPAAGAYMLEFRYAARPWGMSGGDRGSSPLTINGERVSDLVLWGTAGLQTWAWDRTLVKLRGGKNTIRLTPTTQPNIDHLNVLPLD